LGRVSDTVGVMSDRSILAELGLTTVVGDGVAGGTVTVVPEMCVPGAPVLRTSVLSAWADILTGAVCGMAMQPRIPLTLDLEIQLLRPILSGTALRLDAHPVKIGRAVALADTTVRDAGSDELLARSYVSFIASPNPEHVWPSGTFPELAHLGGRRLAVPFDERVGGRIVEPGTSEVPYRGDGLNASGAIQGAIVAFGGEEAARSAVEHPTVVEHLVLRYLRPFTIGPAVSVAEVSGAVAVVEVTDAGSGKLGALATMRLLDVSAYAHDG
jgi:acyl-coenzyme A thioesterase PaaI-like protein